MIRSVPGARILIPEVVFAIDDGDKNALVNELLSIDRPNAPFDANKAAQLLQTPSAQPVKFDDRQKYAVLRALDNLRSGNRIDERSELLRIRDALCGALQLPFANYELQLPNSTNLTWTSYSGPREIGDRLCTHDGDWRVATVEKRQGHDDLLVCDRWVEPEDDPRRGGKPL